MKNKSKISLPVKASIAFTIANFLQQGINLITIPLFTRLMPENVFGVVSVFNAWSGVLSVIVTLSLVGGVINNGMTDFSDDKDGFISSLLGLVTLSVLGFYALFALGMEQVQQVIQLPTILIHFMFITFMFNAASGFWMAKQRYDYKYRLVVLINFLNAIVGPLLAYYFVIINPDNQAVARIIGGALISLVINIVIYISIFVKGKKFINLKYWKYALLFNLPLIPHYLSYIVLAQSDRIMIANIVSDAAVGIYSIAYSLGTVSMILFTSINSSYIPWTYKQLKVNNYEGLRKKTNILVVLGATWCLGFILLAPEAIQILAPPTYYEAVYVVPPVVMGMYFTFVYSFFANVEFYHKQTKKIMYASVTAAILNFALNLIFIPIFGFVAAGYTTMIGYLALCFVHYRFMKQIETAEVYDIRFITIVSVGITIASLLINLIYDMAVIRYGMIGVGLVLVLIFHKKIIKLVKQILQKRGK